MATIALNRSGLPNVGWKHFWETLTEADSAEAAELNSLSGLAGSVQVTGTFGGATVTLQSSNDGTNFATMKDPAGNDISMTSAGMSEFSTAARYIRPSATGGTAQDVDVTVIARGN